MRFDDSLKTVLAAERGPGFGAQSAWRQLVDLMGRGRVVDAADEALAMARLAELRPVVAATVRAASARALAFAKPSAALVAFFAEDDLPIAAPVLRTAALDAQDWLTLLPRLTPVGRSVLRQRRDLAAEVVRGLDSFGATDFALADGGIAVPDAVPADPVVPADHDLPAMADAPEGILLPEPSPDTPRSPTPFVALGDITRGLPVVAEALRHAEDPSPSEIGPPPSGLGLAAPAAAEPGPRFEIADLVARIDAFQRDREDAPPPQPAPTGDGGFRFETDAGGTIRWVEGVARAALIGVSVARPGGAPAGDYGNVRIDAGVAAAFRRRTPFADLRMEVDGLSDAAGSWRIAGTPLFDRATGRFTGFHGAGRRPLRHESAAPAASRSATSEGLRQLVHELRTPANAVAGFAELIETELLGPVAEPYRRRAGAIRSQASELLTAIDDLDTAARIEGRALDLRPGIVAMGDLAARLATDLAPLTRQRGATLTLSGEEAVAAVDDRAVERLMARLLSTLVSAASHGERIGITVHPVGDQAIVAFDRPHRLADLSGDALFSLDGMAEAEDGGPLLGAGFTLRLVRNLAIELGGSLSIEAERLVLRLPAVRDAGADPVSEPA